MNHQLRDMPPGMTCTICHGEGTTLEPCEGGEQVERCGHCGGSGECDCESCDDRAAASTTTLRRPAVPRGLLAECRAALPGDWRSTPGRSATLEANPGHAWQDYEIAVQPLAPSGFLATYTR